MSRLATKAKIKRASDLAQRKAGQLDAEAIVDLRTLYEQAVNDLNNQLARYTNAENVLTITVLQNALQEANQVLSSLRRSQEELLIERMRRGAALGASVVKGIIDAENLETIINDSVMSARNFVGSDGLQLSDRIWRVNQGAKESMERALQMAVIQGYSASQAAQDFLTRGAPIPKELLSKIRSADVSGIGRVMASNLLLNDDSAYANARRVFRTEINRAHGLAYRKGVFEVDDVVGTKFLLSPSHPKRDICDMHATVNRYGLGKGVYPEGKSPWPAHPNTLSYEVAVFVDEVTDDDKQNFETLSGWLQRQPGSVRDAVLGGRRKRLVFDNDLLPESAFTTPWYVIKERLQKRGVDIDGLIPRKSRSTTGFNLRERVGEYGAVREVRSFLSNYYASVGLNGMSIDMLNSVARATDKVLGNYGIKLSKINWGRGRSYDGQYTFRGIVGLLYQSDQLTLNKRFAQKESHLYNAKHLAWLEKQKKTLGILQARLNDEPDAGYATKLTALIQQIKATKRGGTHLDASDPIFATIAHEAGHALYYRGKQVIERWKNGLTKFNVTRLDHLKVSDYAASKIEELFAEVTSLVAQERIDDIPENVLNAYWYALKNFEEII